MSVSERGRTEIASRQRAIEVTRSPTAPPPHPHPDVDLGLLHRDIEVPATHGEEVETNGLGLIIRNHEIRLAALRRNGPNRYCQLEPVPARPRG